MSPPAKPGKHSSRVPTSKTKSAGAANNEAMNKIRESIERNELVVVVGTGVSMALTNGKVSALSWKGLIRNGFAYGAEKGKIKVEQVDAWKSQLESNDLDDLLGAAEFMGRKLDAPNGNLYGRWLEKVFKSVQPASDRMKKAIKLLRFAGIPLCTLNYDSLLEEVTGLPSVNMTETTKVVAWMRRETPAILHLHGSWGVPQTCILGIRDYETTVGDEVRDLIQRSLGSFNRLLFIGCGDTFADPNFSALVGWLKSKVRTAAPQHYALVRDDDLAARHADPTWQEFVEPVSYGPKHDDLAEFLNREFAIYGRSKKETTAVLSGQSESAPSHAQLIQEYRSYLLRDCGQMTIEGVRADMDTAQRRFDLERLFVPLKVEACPPEIPDTDPEREKKLIEWRGKNNAPLPFGEVFAKHGRLALLALPGGGKSLLLKRLSVAYAEPNRLKASKDELPNLPLTPVLIRCREWREHIHRPILILLRNIPDITGQSALTGLDLALIPLFSNGSALLLVDGLDEIHDDALRSTFVDHLEAFLEDYKLTRLVVTSREAGFNLVAPSLARFCERWRVAPLEDDAISALCDHWHRLMTGDSPEALHEGREVSRQLLKNSSLQRLAENPLLLTMLLVVKHGAGRLPPDRVSLYERAVEVLLDTWNIKGHDPLNLKEAVPQLAFVAFRLMRARKQTATEKELLDLLEEARESVPQIRRYAKDTPQQFFRRVELRSSLLVEAGHQIEGKATVPFYQFRHLTFQEYLAAVAVVQGIFIGYKTEDTVLTPLSEYLLAEDWKEVIPMTAVLAGKQAEPLLSALVAEGIALKEAVESGKKQDLLWDSPALPVPVARLVQCLSEEAEASPGTLTAILQLITFFALGCRSSDDWKSLARGPYGEELFHQSWLAYSGMHYPATTMIANTCVFFAGELRPIRHWESAIGKAEIIEILASDNLEKTALGVFSLISFLFHRDGVPRAEIGISLLPDLEELMLQKNNPLAIAAAWAWGLMRSHSIQPPLVPVRILDRLLELFIDPPNGKEVIRIVFALATSCGQPRESWSPVLDENAVQLIRASANDDSPTQFESTASLVVAYHAKNVYSENELAQRLLKLRKGNAVVSGPEAIGFMLNQIGVDDLGQKEDEK